MMRVAANASMHTSHKRAARANTWRTTGVKVEQLLWDDSATKARDIVECDDPLQHVVACISSALEANPLFLRLAAQAWTRTFAVTCGAKARQMLMLLCEYSNMNLPDAARYALEAFVPGSIPILVLSQMFAHTKFLILATIAFNNSKHQIPVNSVHMVSQYLHSVELMNQDVR